MNLHRVFWVAVPMAALLVVGCQNNSGSTEATETAAEAVAKAPGAGRSHGHRGFGMAGTMFRAARDLNLSTAQVAAIDKLEEQFRTSARPARGDRAEVRAILVEGIRAGKIDTAKLAAAEGEREKAMEAHRAKEAEALNGLYAALQPAQRKALVAAVRERQADHRQRFANKEGRGMRGPREGHRLDRMTRELGLDAAQQASVKAILDKRPEPAAPPFDEMAKRFDAMLTAFEGDAFDAGKLQLGRPGFRPPGLEHADLLAQVLPVLRADQREKLAANMERPRGHRGHRGEHRGHMAPPDAEEGQAPAE